MITKPLTTAIETNKPLYLTTNISTEKPGSMGTPPPSQISSPGETLQNIIQLSDKVSEGNTSANEPGQWILVPIGEIPPQKKKTHPIYCAKGKQSYVTHWLRTEMDWGVA
jgi:hypothetical protein